MANFKPGDLVVLKSGGPTMTIDTVNTDIFDDDKITGLLCVWFVGDIMQRVRFDHRAVRLTSARHGVLLEPDTADGLATAGAANGMAAAAPLRASITMAAPEIVPATAKKSAKAPEAATEPAPAEPAAAISTDAPPPADIAAAPPQAGTAPEATETPAAEAPPEATGDYAAVLDSMVGAMNATADLMAAEPRPARRAKSASKTSSMRAVRSKGTTTH
ncbi:MAG: DUF2158 domain-containing protein [Xanthobacteraceae bacterium]|nr:DUF2158 domain-containing protein [Xanthobacteraceae bacterium]